MFCCRLGPQAKLEHAHDALAELGAATTDDLFELGPEDLDTCGLRKLERKRPMMQMKTTEKRPKARRVSKAEPRNLLATARHSHIWL